MKINRLSELINKCIDDYINNIAFELEQSHDRLFDSFGFPMFGETSYNYHEQVYYDSYLEYYTRLMINKILQKMADEDVEEEIEWPELELYDIYKGYTNAEYEEKYGFDFINYETKIGYRYTYFSSIEEADKLLNSNNDIDKIEIVMWEEKDTVCAIQYDDERIKVVLLWDMFHELFENLPENEINSMYDLFTGEIAKAVKRANSLIFLTTLPGFTSSYLYRAREESMSAMQNEVRSISSFYVNNIDYKNNEINSRVLINIYKLPEYFLDKKFERAFFGTSDFAKSFMTSEYLFRYFKDNPLFDYTPIVSGYIKSVEQILHIFCENYYRRKNVKKDFSDYTLGKYITAIKREKCFRKELIAAKNIIIGCLNSYRVESRNNLFHKDYFNEWNKVEQIRNNTLFLYIALFGAVDPEILTYDPSVLGILNVEYNQLFKIVDESKYNTFSIVIDGKEYSRMWKEPRSRGLVFDRNGLITNEIIFKTLKYDYNETVKISRTKMPSKVWIQDALGNNKIIWPVK